MVELLKEIVSGVKRVGVIRDAAIADATGLFESGA
jgi:hypothetical protein